MYLSKSVKRIPKETDFEKNKKKRNSFFNDFVHSFSLKVGYRTYCEAALRSKFYACDMDCGSAEGGLRATSKIGVIMASLLVGMG
jgi:hypothetical protein